MGNCVCVTSVDMDGPAAKQGIKPGARLLSVDGCPLYPETAISVSKNPLTRPSRSASPAG